MQRLAAFANRIDRLSTAIGKGGAAILLVLVCVQAVGVLARHAFGMGFLYAQDSALYLFALAMLCGVCWLSMSDGHVRVDLFRDSAGPRTKRLLDVIGIVGLWLPFAGTLFYLSLPYAAASWQVLEGSRDPAGLDLVFLLKSSLPVFAALLFLQGLARGIALLALEPTNR